MYCLTKMNNVKQKKNHLLQVVLDVFNIERKAGVQLPSLGGL